MSNINYLGINENFPVAGEDNDTQVFRDNFDTIKTSLQTAKDEITDLQDNAARTDLEEVNFNRTVIRRAVIQDTYERLASGGEITIGTINPDFEDGSYHIYSFTTNCTISFLGLPDENADPRGNAKMTLELYSNNTEERTLTFVTTSGTVLKKSNNWPETGNILKVSSSTNPKIIEVWRNRNDRIFLNYVGQFSS